MKTQKQVIERIQKLEIALRREYDERVPNTDQIHFLNTRIMELNWVLGD
jgi:hypothetical protein